MQVLLHTQILSPPKRNKAIAKENTEKFNNSIVPYLVKRLQAQPYFGGNEISAVDCMVSSILLKAKNTSLLENHQSLWDYMERISNRDAFKASHFPPYCTQ